MTEEQLEYLRIEGPGESLERLRDGLIEELGDGVEVQRLSAAVPGELHEAVTIAIVVAFTPPLAIKVFGDLVGRCMTHRERMEELRTKRENSDREISLAEFLAGKPPQ